MKNALQVAHELVDALKADAAEAAAFSTPALKVSPQPQAVAAKFVSRFQAAEAPLAGLSVWVRRALPSMGISGDVTAYLANALS
jgi:hypothetical protein